jgi:regulator of replication initiation timing
LSQKRKKNQNSSEKKTKQRQKQTNKQTNIIRYGNFIKLFLMQFTMFLFKDEDCYFCLFIGRRVDAC